MNNNVYMKAWRRKRKAKAEVLGVATMDLPNMRGVAKNRSNYYSKKHHNYLYKAAHKIANQFKGYDFDIDELVNVGWYRCARYHEDVTREYQRILTKMFVFAMSQIKKVDFYSVNVPVFVNNEILDVLFEEENAVSINDNIIDRVEEILKLCSSEEKELLYVRFYKGLTLEQIGEMYNKSQSNLTIKYQRLFERIQKRLRGEKTRGLRISLR